MNVSFSLFCWSWKQFDRRLCITVNWTKNCGWWISTNFDHESDRGPTLNPTQMLSGQVGFINLTHVRCALLLPTLLMCACSDMESINIRTLDELCQCNSAFFPSVSSLYFFFASLSLLIAWQLTEWKWMPFNSTPFTSTWVFRYPHIAVINSEFIHAATPNFNTLTQLNVEWIKTASLWTSSTSSYKCMKMSRIKWKPNVPSTRFWTSNKSKRRL